MSIDNNHKENHDAERTLSNSHLAERSLGFGTIAIHHGQEPESVTGAVIPPIFLSTTFAQIPYVGHKGYEYSRSGNPTRDALEKAIAKLEGGKHGFLFSSGLGSTSTFFSIFPQGSEVIVCDDAYGGTLRYLNNVASKLNVVPKVADLTVPENIIPLITPDTKVIWLETPTNPTLKVIDISVISRLAKQNNPDILIVVDNTIMTPFFQNPLKHGADVVAHSVTKYINGHSDVVMGALVTSNEEIAAKLRYYQNAVGSVPSPFDCFLAHRGLKTLHLRMKKCEENAMKIAESLINSAMVKSVNYPGLESHPQHAIALKQQSGFGGMISFVIKGDKRHSQAFLNNLKLFCYGESLGGIESLIEVPAIMTHASVPEAQREKLGIIDTFIRISVGIEEAEDLLYDINFALKAAQNVK